MAQDKSALAVAAIYTSDAEANIALGMLRTNGIPCELNGELAYGVMGIQLTPNDGIRLMVRAEDLDAALKLLAENGDLD